MSQAALNDQLMTLGQQLLNTFEEEWSLLEEGIRDAASFMENYEQMPTRVSESESDDEFLDIFGDNSPEKYAEEVVEW